MNYRRTFALLSGWMLALCAVAQIPLTVGEAPDLPSDEGLLVYLPFDGSIDNLATGGSALEGTDVAFVDGACGQAAEFNGIDDYLRLIQTLDLQEDYTFTAWVHPYSQTEEHVAFAVRDQCTSTYRGYSQAQVGFNQMAVDGWSSQVNVHVNCTSWSAGDRYRNTDLTLPNNTTSFVAVVVSNNSSEGRTVTLHANCGAFETEMTIDFPTDAAFGSTPDYETTFGAKSSVPGRTATFDGWIDEVRVYARTLDDDELESLYRQCAPVDWEYTLSGTCEAVAEVTVFNSQPGITYSLINPADSTAFDGALDGNCETLVFTTPVITAPTSAWIDNSVNTPSGEANTGFTPFDIDPPPGEATGSLVQEQVCAGDSVLWNGASYSTSGTYTFEVTDGFCPQVDTLEMVVVPLPTLALPEAVSTCDPEVTLEAPEAVDWMDGSSGTSFFTSTSGWVWASVEENGCIATDSTLVTLGSVTLDLGEDLELCAGTTAVLNPDGALDLLWSDGSTGTSLEVSASGTYSATLTSGDCSASDEIEVNVLPLPVVDLPENVSSCDPTVTLETTEEVTWMDGTTSTTLEVSSTGWVWATQTENGCTATDSTWVTLGAIELSLGADTTLCWGQTLVLDPPGDAPLTWSDGSVGTTFEVTASGSYSATLDNGECASTATIEVLALGTLPTLDAPAVLCPDATAEIVLTPEQPSAVWSTGEVGSSTQTGPGTVTVEVSQDQCTWNAEAVIDAVDLPENPLAPAYTLCNSAPELQVISETPVTWPDGSTGEVYTPPSSGTLEVTTDSPCGPLSFSTEITLTFCDCHVYVPNAFTPDRDGLNEVFAPVLDCPIEAYQLRIFSRNGQQVFATEDPSEGWNGGIDHAYVQHDVYVWRLEYRPTGSAEPLLLEGHVVVIR